MPRTRPCTASASGPACGARRACSTTVCRTRRGSSGSPAPAMTPWGGTRTPCAVRAGWPSWPCRSLCPACAATCLCAPACAVGRDVAAVGESTRRSDEARCSGGGGKKEGFLAPGAEVAGRERERRSRRNPELGGGPSKPRGASLHSAFFHSSVWGLPRLARAHSDRAFGSHSEPLQWIYPRSLGPRERSETRQKQRRGVHSFKCLVWFFLFCFFPSLI